MNRMITKNLKQRISVEDVYVYVYCFLSPCTKANNKYETLKIALGSKNLSVKLQLLNGMVIMTDEIFY